MRGSAILPALAAGALLAGCGVRQETDRNTNNQLVPASGSSASNSSGPAAPEPVPPPATGKTIPAAMLGVYDASLEACGQSSEARLTVSPTELRFHESIGTVRQVTTAGAEAASVDADYQGEGESWRNLRVLRLGDGGKTLTISGDGTRLVLVRCPEDGR
jgi:hypothetical protein